MPSEILFTGLIQGVVAAITVVVAYLLGKRQADMNWRRDLEERQKEHAEEMEILRRQVRVEEKQLEGAESERSKRDHIGPVD